MNFFRLVRRFYLGLAVRKALSGNRAPEEHRSTSPRFVLLTSGGEYARALTSFLKTRKIDFEIVAVRPLPPKRRRQQNRFDYWRTAISCRLKSNKYLRVLAGKELPRFDKAHVNGGFLNSRKLQETLRRLRPDYILLMNVGIVSRQVIHAAKSGVLNAHPGLLPWVRGVDAVASSLLEGVAPGTTVHFVDEGIDTGPIVCRYLLPPEANETLAQLKDRTNVLALLAMMESVEAIHSGCFAESFDQTLRFGLHTRLKPDELGAARGIASSERPKELYDKWRVAIPELSDGASLFSKYRWFTDSCLGRENSAVRPLRSRLLFFNPDGAHAKH